MRNLLLTFVLAALVGGCENGGNQTSYQTDAQRVVANTRSVMTTASAQLRACRIQVRQQPEFVSLIPHLPDQDGNYSMTILMDNSLPSAEDARLLLAYHEAFLPCRSQYLTTVNTVRPDIAAIKNAGHSRYDEESAALLIKRKISWSEDARRAQQLGNEVTQQIIAANQQWGARLEASHQAEEANNQAAGLAVLGILSAMPHYQPVPIPQYVPPPMPQSHSFSCYTIGNMTNCN